MVTSVANDSIRELLDEREKKIAEFRRNQRLRLQKKYFLAWLKTAKKQRKRKNALLHFPAMPGSSQLVEQVSAGNTNGLKHHCTIDFLFDWFGISCMTTDNCCFYLQNRLIQTS